MTAIALFTGGGIGRALARLLHARGCLVAAAGRDARRLADVQAAARIAAATDATRGLRVNAVAPGVTDTPMTAGMMKLPAVRDDAARQHPLGGLQTADQVADAMAWLLGDGASRPTGQVLVVDGGFTTVRPLVK